jgi:hypothetical protein
MEEEKVTVTIFTNDPSMPIGSMKTVTVTFSVRVH